MEPFDPKNPNEENIFLEKTINLAKNNDQKSTRYLINRYRSMVYSIINKGFFLKNGSKEDLVQEGLIGLSKAIKDFNADKGNGKDFKSKMESFFYTCVYRALISAIKTSNRKKNGPLNNMASLDRPLQENDNLTVMDIIASRSDIQQTNNFEYINPEEQLILEDTIERYKNMLENDLSQNEKDVYELRLQKYSYKEIQDILGYDKIKPIDNALRRVKVKLNNIIEQEEKKTRDFL